MSALVMFLVRVGILVRTINCRYRDFFEILMYPLAITGLSVRMAMWAKMLLEEALPVFVFGGSGLVFLVTFALLTYLADRLTGAHLMSVLGEIRRIFRDRKTSSR